MLKDVVLFCKDGSRLKLRCYQEEVAKRIVDSVLNKRGDTIVVIFPRQSGKNELQAQIETYLLTLYSQLPAEMVKASPTWKPQSLNAMRRLERVLSKNLLSRDRMKKEEGYIYRAGTARIYFFSGQKGANVVGATANLLLECDEAQDVGIAKWDKDFAPMAASTNATRVFWGTAWTSKTLLARELRVAKEAEKKDGRKRVYLVDAATVTKEVPEYGEFVASQVAKLGRNHPLVKTQYFSEEIDAEGGLFPAERRALMQGDHARIFEPAAGKIYAFLLDVAGEDESGGIILGGDIDTLANKGRDSTTLTVVEVDLSTLEDDLINAPTYRVVNRRAWIGVKHAVLYGEIKAIAELWDPLWIVMDSTGVGEGITSFLEKALPGKVIPFKFTHKSKSDLGWGFLSVVETGRFKDYMTPGQERAEFWLQLEYVQYEAKENQALSWSVPDGTRDPGTGDLVHDDWVLSAALCSLLDDLEWGLAESEVIEGFDPLEGMKEAF